MKANGQNPHNRSDAARTESCRRWANTLFARFQRLFADRLPINLRERSQERSLRPSKRFGSGLQAGWKLQGSDCRGHDLHNPIRTARPPRDSYRMSETQVVEDNVHSVIALGIECSAHGRLP